MLGKGADAARALKTGENSSGLAGRRRIGRRAATARWRPTMTVQDSKTTPRPLIVLVEDDVSVRQALTFALRIEGFDVEVHDSAEALLQALDLPQAACLVLDQNLPGALGIDALDALRRRGLACPAILITTHPRPEVRAAAVSLHVRILEKPLLGGELPAAIREALAT